MWVEVDHDKVATSFKRRDRIRVECESRVYDGLFLKVEFGKFTQSTFVNLTHDDFDYPICLYVWPGRKFFRWEEDKPEKIQWVDQSELRLRKPDEMAREVEEAEANLVRNLNHTARIGKRHYTLREGDHLRAWIEDGRLHTELVEGE